jgi:hypothetical protein
MLLRTWSICLFKVFLSRFANLLFWHWWMLRQRHYSYPPVYISSVYIFCKTAGCNLLFEPFTSWSFNHKFRQGLSPRQTQMYSHVIVNGLIFHFSTLIMALSHGERFGIWMRIPIRPSAAFSG